jgi:hypothetical protein
VVAESKKSKGKENPKTIPRGYSVERSQQKMEWSEREGSRF